MTFQSNNVVLPINPREQQTRSLHQTDKLFAEIDYLREALGLNQRIAQDVIQPLMAILTMAELGQLENGLNSEDCSVLHEAATQLRELLQCFTMSADGTRHFKGGR